MVLLLNNSWNLYGSHHHDVPDMDSLHDDGDDLDNVVVVVFDDDVDDGKTQFSVMAIAHDKGNQTNKDVDGFVEDGHFDCYKL